MSKNESLPKMELSQNIKYPNLEVTNDIHYCFRKYENCLFKKIHSFLMNALHLWDITKNNKSTVIIFKIQ